MKRIILIICTLITIKLLAEPYRPYPVIFVHGYAANNFETSKFGLLMKMSENPDGSMFACSDTNTIFITDKYGTIISSIKIETSDK